ncbi:MAG: ribosome biogenesis GTP-binding protein YsxC, partial [Selenomonas sp.]|nr:ribosome biogenesis GTP-binding protein YsxC [Selenomonas sp.]
NLARVSSQPGKTQTINFFEVGVKIAEVEERKAFYLVDLPGYGYATTGKEKRKIWSKFIEEYPLNSPRLIFVCQLIDSRHEPMASDVEMFNWLVDNGIPVLIIATKVDKIGKNERAKNIAAIKRKLGIKEISVLPYSSLKNEGRSDLLDVIGDSLLE